MFKSNKKMRGDLKRALEEVERLQGLCNRYSDQAKALEERLEQYETRGEVLKFEQLSKNYQASKDTITAMKAEQDAREKAFQGYIAAILFDGIESAEKCSMFIKKEVMDEAVQNCTVKMDINQENGCYEFVAERKKK